MADTQGREPCPNRVRVQVPPKLPSLRLWVGRELFNLTERVRVPQA
jgi:hypothetical protein